MGLALSIAQDAKVKGQADGRGQGPEWAPGGHNIWAIKRTRPSRPLKHAPKHPECLCGAEVGRHVQGIHPQGQPHLHLGMGRI